MRAALAPLAGRARAGAASTGPWPAARTARAAGALAAAAVLATWTVGSGHPLAGLLAFFAVAGLVVLAGALVQGRGGPVGLALALLGAPAAVVAAGASAAEAAGAGVALVAALELSRWSVQRRVAVPGSAREWRRWAHLTGVVAAGWLLGAGIVGLASARLAVGGWQAPLGALAAVAVAAAVAAAAAARR